MVVSELTERAEMPMVTYAVSDQLTARGFKYLFQNPAKGSLYGQTQLKFAKHLVDNKGLAPKVAIIFENTAYGQSTSSGMKSAAASLGFEIALFESYEANFADAGPLATKIKSSGAKILLPVSYLQDSILIQKAINQMGIDIYTIGGGAGYLMPDFYKALGKAAEGVTSVGTWNHDLKKPNLSDITKRYQERYKELPVESSGTGYLGIMVVTRAIEKAASTDPKKVRDALASLKIEPGTPGDLLPGPGIEFNEVGLNKNAHPIIIQWQEGVPRTVYPAEDATVQLK